MTSQPVHKPDKSGGSGRNVVNTLTVSPVFDLFFNLLIELDE